MMMAPQIRRPQSAAKAAAPSRAPAQPAPPWRGRGHEALALRPSARFAYGVLQRKCACGAPAPGAGTCATCAEEQSGLQRKLAIGSTSDPLEHEADRVADRVLADRSRADLGGIPPTVQRHATKGTEASQNAPASVDRALATPGSPLHVPLRRDMEARFGHNFSQVRVHDGSEAALSARDVGALAYTVGRDIVFAAGQFAPSTGEGRRLLAHELTHVVQQSGAAPARGAGGRDAASASSGTPLLQRTPAAPTNAAGAAVRDLGRIRIDPVADFLASSLVAAKTVNIHINDATIVHLSWELYDPADQLMEGSFSTLPGDAASTSRPFKLQPSHFSGAGFVPGKYILRCVGRTADHQPAIFADRDFNVVKTDLTTNTALPTTFGSFTFTRYSKTDVNLPATPAYSIHAELQFVPAATVSCESIGFLQNYQTIDSQGKSQQSPVSAEQAARQTKLAWSIDRVVGGPEPFYGTERVGAGPITIPVGKGAFGSGGAAPTTATLKDTPRWNVADNVKFESCAVCRSGPNIGQVYGCATWGYTAAADGKVTLMPRTFRQMPSDQFEEARVAWNSWQAGLPAATRPAAAPALKSP